MTVTKQRRFRRTAWSVVLLVGIAAAAVAQSSDDAPEIPGLGALLEEGSCVAHEFNVPGQGVHLSGSGVHLSGSVGGMMLGPITYTDANGVYSPTTVAPQTVNEVFTATGKPAQYQLVIPSMLGDAVIVVADDFAGGAFEVPPSVFGLTDDPSDHDALMQLVENGDFSHGALVMHHLNTLVAANGGFVLLEVDPKRFIWQQVESGHHLVVAALDMSTAASQAITAEDVFKSLAVTLIEVVRGLPPYVDPSALVVNMSWVFLPCATVQEFLDNIAAYPSVTEYVEAVAPGFDFAVVMEQLGQVVHAGLEAMLDEGRLPDVAVDHISFVAASGNFSLPYQMLPAGWSQVVGVGVAPVLPTFPSRYSNAADVIVPPEWLRLQQWVGTPGVVAPTDLSYAGTSYAAPLVSLYVAEDLVGEQFCVQHSTAAPPLTTGKAGTSFTPPGDVWLPTAVDRCP